MVSRKEREKPAPAKGKISTTGLLVIAALFGLAWYFGKVSAPVQALAEEKKKEDPTLTDEEAITSAAVEVSSWALYAAQQAEYTAQVQAAAEKVRMYESQLAAKQSRAILAPTIPEVVAEAEAAEAEARIARAELEASWTEALNIAVREMEVAKPAAIAAVDAHISAYDRYLKFVDIVKQAFQTVLKAQQDIDDLGWFYSGTAMYRLEQALLNSENQLKLMEDLREQHLKSAMATKAEAIHVISNANDCVERVLTITADLRLLGILLALASRTDAIAIATRTKLGELELRLYATEV